MPKQTVILSSPSEKNILTADRTSVSLLGSLAEFAEELQKVQDHTFIGYDADITMDKAGKMRVTDNPFAKRGMIKRQTAQATVNFDYDKKREARDGDEPVRKGFTWHTPVMIKGKVTPLSVKKDDVVTDDAKGNARKAILDKDGNTQFTTDEPSLYLRYEYVRDGGEGEREDRKMRSKSVYLIGDEVIPTEEVEKFLPDKKRGDNTDFHVLTLGEVTRLSIGGKVYRRATIG